MTYKPLMKFVMLMSILTIGCKQKTNKEYSDIFIKNKDKFIYFKNDMQNLLKHNDSLYKLGIEVTGRRFVENSYINDSVTENIEFLSLTQREKMNDIMYELNINYIFSYRDSIVYIFSGRYKDKIIIYNVTPKKSEGVLIDTNTYLVLDND